MRLFWLLIKSMLLGLLLGCAANIWVGERKTPKVEGIDPIAQTYVDEWLNTAKLYGVTIKDDINLGVRDINRRPVVGECFRGLILRKVVIDERFWFFSTSIQKALVVYHELGHCYCNREHGWGKTGEYGDDESSRKDPSKADGFYSDNCPKSIMYPYVLDSDCYLNHYSEYMEELFTNCEPNAS